MYKKNRLQYLALLFVCAFTLSACSSPATPQEVVQDFWEAVITNNPDKVVKYSTLARIGDYDQFSREWSGYQPDWGEIRINGNRASVVSEFSSPANSGKGNRKFRTFLVQRNEVWLVDYDKTADDMRENAFGSLLGTLDKLGEDLSKQLELSSEELNSEMEKLSAKLKALSEDITQEAKESIERFAIELQQSIRELEESINRGLDDRRLSPKDKRLLQEISADLSENDNRLSQPTVESIVASSNNISEAQAKLASIEGEASAEFQREWMDLTAEMETILNEFHREFSKSN